MKKIVFLSLFAAFSTYAQSDVVKLTAKIENRNGDTLFVFGPQKFKKAIPVNKKGEFTDSFAVTTGPYQLYDGVEQTLVFLKNGYDLQLNMNAKEFDETIVYKGKGANENNFLAQKALNDEKFEETLETLKDDAAFDAALASRLKGLEDKLNAPGMDEEFKSLAGKMLKGESQQMSMQFKSAQAMSKLTGNASPTFDYENHKGGKTKLEDLKGKYVYIDTWATWCGPCRAEIPHLKTVEAKYHGKKIEFVSISIDVAKDHEKWKKFVDEKQLGGVQLFADNDWNSKFVRDFGINSIPRFILIGPDGKVVDANAKRPSDPALQTQLDSLLK